MSTIQRTPAGIIDGTAVSSRYSVFPVIDPSTEEVLAEVPVSDAATVEAAVSAAERAFGRWADTPISERDRLLNALADRLLAHQHELADLEARNTGKPRSAAAAEVAGAVARLRSIGAAAHTIQSTAAAEHVRNRTFLRRHPIGVIGVTTPWNYPIMMAVLTIGPALAAGNTVVLKPSALTPLTTLRLAELAADVLPRGVLNVVAGDEETTTPALVRHPHVRMAVITGEAGTGSPVPADAVASIARSPLAPGGKAPVIVFADADLDRVTERLRVAAFANCGQDRTAVCRVLVAESRYEDLLARLVAQVRSLRVAGPFDGEPDLGPVISERHQRLVIDFIDRAAAAGAEVAVGGHTPADTGYFLEPAVIGLVPPRSAIARTEVFGPVITVQQFRDEAEALEIAHESDHAVTASVWSEDTGRCLRMADQLRFALVWVNDHMTLADEAANSGFPISGYGAVLAPYRIEDFSVIRHVLARID